MKTIYQQRYIDLIELMILARKNVGKTQANLAEQLGKHQSYIAKIEGCERKVDVVEFVEICKIIGASPSDLIKALE